MRVKGIMTMVIRTAKIVIVGFLVIGMVYSMTNGMVKDYLEDTMGAVVSKADETSNEFTALAKIHYGEAYICTDGDHITKIYGYQDGSGLLEEYRNGVKTSELKFAKGHFQYKVEEDNFMSLVEDGTTTGQFSKDGTRLTYGGNTVFILEEEIPKMFENIHWGEAYVAFSFTSGVYEKVYFYEDGSIVPDLYNIYGNLVAENLFGAEAGSHKYEIQSDGLVHITHIQGSGTQMKGYFSIDGSIYYSEYSEGVSCAFWESKQKTKMSDVIGNTYVASEEDFKCELIIKKDKLTMRTYDASGKLEGEESLNENEFIFSEGDIGVYLYSENELIGLFYNQGTEFITDGDVIFLRN